MYRYLRLSIFLSLLSKRRQEESRFGSTKARLSFSSPSPSTYRLRRFLFLKRASFSMFALISLVSTSETLLSDLISFLNSCSRCTEHRSCELIETYDNGVQGSSSMQHQNSTASSPGISQAEIENFLVGLPGRRMGETVFLARPSLRMRLEGDLEGDLEGERLDFPLSEAGLVSLVCRQSTRWVWEQRPNCPFCALLILTDGTQERAIMEATFSTELWEPRALHSLSLPSCLRCRFSFKNGRSYIFSTYRPSIQSQSEGSRVLLGSSSALMSGKREKLDSESMVASRFLLTGGRNSVCPSGLREKMDLRLPCMICCRICSILLMLLLLEIIIKDERMTNEYRFNNLNARRKSSSTFSPHPFQTRPACKVHIGMAKEGIISLA